MIFDYPGQTPQRTDNQELAALLIRKGWVRRPAPPSIVEGREALRWNGTAWVVIQVNEDKFAEMSDAQVKDALAKRIKERASEIILSRKSISAQINQIARGMDLLFKAHETGALTDSELAELREGRDLYRNFVLPIRRKSNELEAGLAEKSRRDLLEDELSGWPDDVWGVLRSKSAQAVEKPTFWQKLKGYFSK